MADSGSNQGQNERDSGKEGDEGNRCELSKNMQGKEGTAAWKIVSRC